MATAEIAEYKRLARDRDGSTVMTGEEPRVASQSVTYTTSTQITTALNKATRFVLITTNDTAAHWNVGTSPTATAADPHIPANGNIFLGVNPTMAEAGTLKVALYDGTS